MPMRRMCPRRSLVILGATWVDLSFIVIFLSFTIGGGGSQKKLPSSLGGRLLHFGDHRIAQPTEAFDLDLAKVARLHEQLGLARKADARRRTHDQNISRIKGHGFAYKSD